MLDANIISDMPKNFANTQENVPRGNFHYFNFCKYMIHLLYMTNPFHKHLFLRVVNDFSNIAKIINPLYGKCKLYIQDTQVN